MIITVTEYEKSYQFQLENITQLCGQNVGQKAYMMESLRKYFSTYKYSEKRNKWRDNILVDGEIVGRKYFSVISVSNRDDLIGMIKLSKQSLLTSFVSKFVQEFDWQNHLKIVSDELESMFNIINKDIRRLGDLELTFDPSDVWEMIQKSRVVAYGEESLEDKSTYELLIIVLNLIDETLSIQPHKTMVLLENLDHIVSRDEYVDITNRVVEIGTKHDAYFVISTSLDRYVKIAPYTCEGVSVVGDIMFQFPNYEELMEFINNNYPSSKVFGELQLMGILENIVQSIGNRKYLQSVECSVICKMINKSLLLTDKWGVAGNSLEINFLKV